MAVLTRALRSSFQAFLGRRPGQTIVLVAAMIGVATVGFASAVTTGLIYACVNNSSGTIKVVGATSTCSSNEIMLVWNTEGVQGPAGPAGPTGPEGPTGPSGPAGSFTGTFTSPNGRCSISVTDTGITLGGADCPVRAEARNIDLRAATTIDTQAGTETALRSGTTTSIRSDLNTTLNAGASMTVSAGGVMTIDGGLTLLGGSAACRPAARVNDSVVVVGGDGGLITSGSPTVLICN